MPNQPADPSPQATEQAAPRDPPAAPVPRFQIDWATEPPVVFSNYAYVQTNGEEFALVFCEGFAFGDAAPTVPARARIVASVRLTPAMFFRLTGAMTTNWNDFAERVGAAGPKPPTFEIRNPADQPDQPGPVANADQT